MCVLLPVQKAAQEKEALIAQLQGEIDAQKAGSERELSSVSSALSRATEEAREKASQAEEAQTALEKLNLRVNEYQACLERVGVNAVSLQVCACVCVCVYNMQSGRGWALMRCLSRNGRSAMPKSSRMLPCSRSRCKGQWC